jgi:uncharacterized small protein (DUF1192 family)
MDADDLLPHRQEGPLSALARQDLDPLSVEELDERIAALQREIERVNARRAFAVNHRASAEELFRK